MCQECHIFLVILKSIYAVLTYCDPIMLEKVQKMFPALSTAPTQLFLPHPTPSQLQVLLFHSILCCSSNKADFRVSTNECEHVVFVFLYLAYFT